MSDLKPLLNRLLEENNLTLADLNNKKNTKVKSRILSDLMSVAIIDSKQKSKKGNPLVGESLKNLRAAGLKFSNKQGRTLFNTGIEKKYKSSYATRLKGGYKPDIDKLPFMEVQTVRGGFLYAARVYLKSRKRKNNQTRIPRKTKEGSVTRMTNDSYYFKTGKYAFWSDEPLSGNTVRKILKDLFKGKMDTDIVNEYVVDTSNTSDIDFQIYTPVAFIYTGAIRT